MTIPCESSKPRPVYCKRVAAGASRKPSSRNSKTKKKSLIWIMGDPGNEKLMLICGILDELSCGSSPL